MGVLSELESLTKSFEAMTDKSVQGTTKLEDFITVVNQTTKAANELNKAISGIGAQASNIVGFERGKAFLVNYAKAFESVMNAISGLASAYNAYINVIDLSTSYSRKMTKELYDSTKAFGLSMDVIDEYGVVVNSMAQELGNAAEGWIRPKDILDGLEALTKAGIPLEKMGDIINTTRGETTLLNVAILQSKALGMDLSKYMEYLSNAITKQGLSSQDATEQMSMFRLVAEKTGFTIDKVANNLQSMSSKFSKMGMTADFGRPLLEGFSNTLKSLGLGFEDAIGLAGELNDAIGGLTSNYASAYITFQRGGLDINTSGTALGASIGLQARMMEAKKEGTQDELALDIAKSMKETIASLTGGQIVTSQEAAATPELEALFATQTSLLQSMYNISDAGSQVRTLDLLKQLDETASAGDMDLASAIGEEMDQAASYQDKMLSGQEKIGIELDKILSSMNTNHQASINEMRLHTNVMVEGFKIGADRAREMAGSLFGITGTLSGGGGGGGVGAGGGGGGGGPTVPMPAPVSAPLPTITFDQLVAARADGSTDLVDAATSLDRSTGELRDTNNMIVAVIRDLASAIDVQNSLTRMGIATR